MTTRLTSVLQLVTLTLTAAWTGLCLHRAWREHHPKPEPVVEAEPSDPPGWGEAHHQLYDDLRGGS